MRVATFVLVLTFLSCAPALGQAPPDPCGRYALIGTVLECSAAGSVREQLRAGTFIAGSVGTGESIAQAVALEVATAPFGSSSGGFTFTFNPAQRAWNRTASTFGPAFAARALTIGRGKISAGFNFLDRQYDTLNGRDLDTVSVFQFRGGSLPVTLSTLELNLRTDTFAGSVHYGLLDHLDVAVFVPYVRVAVQGTTRIFAQAGEELQRVRLDAATSGLGDIAFLAKYRFMHFGPPPSVGSERNAALAAALTVRVPSGNRDNLLGLGVARVFPWFIASATVGRFSPHLNFGYEFWTGAVEAPQDFQEGALQVSIQDQLQYNAGFEYELNPRLTVLGDVVGRYLRGGGGVGYQPYYFPVNRTNVIGADALVTTAQGVHTVTLAPGLKWNAYRSALLTANLLITTTTGGLRDRFTPVLGIDWGF